jgi:hypothetical protein
MDDVKINLPDFLDALAWFMELAVNAVTPGAIVYTAAGTAKRNLWRNAPDEKNSLDPYTVLRLYPGPAQTYESFIPRLNIQVQTVASASLGDDAALSQSQQLFASLQDANNRPLRMTQMVGRIVTSYLPSYTVISVKPLQRPGVISRDERGRAIATWNMEVAVELKAVANPSPG